MMKAKWEKPKADGPITVIKPDGSKYRSLSIHNPDVIVEILNLSEKLTMYERAWLRGLLD